ncbi:MAG: hypothetical protein ACM3ME_01255 [Chloroflexota bacterium]|nr:hypothetical protein [Lentimicrobium sp.]
MKTYRLLGSSGLALVTALLLAGITIKATAQGLNEEVTVTSAFQPSIPDANKINIEPPESETDVPMPVMTYNNKPEQMLVTLKPESISAVKLVGEPFKKLYRNYVKAGMGTYTTPFIDLYAGSLRSKTSAYGLHLKHISSSGVIEDYPIANNSLNEADVYGMRFTDNHTISAEIGFRRNVVHHYGFLENEFNQESLPLSYNYSDDDLKQRFARINAKLGIKSNYEEKEKIHHFAYVGFNNISDLFETRESNISFNAGADKQFELLSFTDYQQLGLTADVDYTRYKDSLITQNSSVVTLKPYISTSFNEYSLKAGLNISFVADSISKAYLFPFIEGQLRIIDDALIVHAGITGGIKRQNFNELSDINPFVQSILPLNYTREKFTFYGGLRARAGSNIDFSALIKTSFVENAYFFVNDYSTIPFNRFTLLQDNGKVFTARFEAQYHSAEHIILKAFAQIETWSLDSLVHAYHVAPLTFGINAMYQIQNKIVMRANVAARSNTYALTLSDSDQLINTTLKSFADVSFGIEYRYTKLLSGFINFNNVTNSRYFVWNNYPSYRFNLMGGVSYSF